ncbi:MAG: hypothetical protein JWO71_2042 [Candidatus Acidoferrum typicum]|nr:hypothetical protein [Candidatus Acidoferrum typicum]
MTEKSALPAWVWPIKLDDYDRNPELKVEELETLRSVCRAWQTAFLLR